MIPAVAAARIGASANPIRLGLWLLAVLSLLLASGCALGPARQQQVDQRIANERSDRVDCQREDRCASASPLLDAARAHPQEHRVALLEHGADALRIRLHLIRSAQRSIDVQTFILRDSASSRLLIDELLAAARRGVHVRVLADQLFSHGEPRSIAQLALAHRLFEMRFHNPTFRESSTQLWEMAVGALCCFTTLNQRMHNKLFLVDDQVGIIGGRNYADTYFDLDPDFVYYDRDLLVSGPSVKEMADSFDLYWQHPLSVPPERLSDVGRALFRGREQASLPLDETVILRQRLDAIARDADDMALIDQRFVQTQMPVQSLRFVVDQPVKARSRNPDANAVSLAFADLLAKANDEVLLQTPYLVIDKVNRRAYRTRSEDRPNLAVKVSTNSLAATDAIPVYALSYKYKKRYLRELGFDIYEFKPVPGDVADMVEGATPEQSPRVSMHAKSAVFDNRIGLVGTHNFDPRSDRYNSEAAVIIDDAAFAQRLAATIRRDIEPANSWLVAKRERGPAPFYRLSRFIESVSTALPIFDFWPFRYASNFELQEGCSPIARDHPDFYRCHADVGNFPGVDSALKRFLTRLGTAFGAPLVPIL